MMSTQHFNSSDPERQELTTERVENEWSKLARVAQRYHPSLGALMEHAEPAHYNDDTLVLTIDVNNESLCSIFESHVEEFKNAFMALYSVPISVKLTVNYREKVDRDTLCQWVIPEPESDQTSVDAWFSQERDYLSLLESPVEIDFWTAASSLIDDLEPQVEVGYYRVDFAVVSKKIAIEIDGYEYHSSKEQLTADAARERHLQKMGWRVIRFTGSEVYRNAHECARDAQSIISVMGGVS